jgi:predicted membrane-bound dolichyl-phosphate-mannose-protein mannosyltransferase
MNMDYTPNLFRITILKLFKMVKWQYFGLLLLVLLSFGLHFGTIVESDNLIFDEVFYVPDARSIIAQEGTLLPEHPPLGKLFIVTGIRIFGDNPLGWRFFSVLFGSASIVLVYFICRSLKMSNRTTTLATVLFGLENLVFIQSSVAMLDVYSFSFLLMSLLLYLRNKFVLSGLLAGMCILIKLPGVLVLGIFFLYWILAKRKNWQSFVVPTSVAVILFLGLLPLLDYVVSGQISNPFQQIGYMIEHTGLLKFTDSNPIAASRPWDWLMNRGAISYSHNPQYIAIVSPTISAAIIPTTFYMLYKAIKHNMAALLGFLWFFCSYIPWVVITIITERLTYIYYMYPVIGAICIGLGLAFSEIINIRIENKNSKTATIGLIAVYLYFILHIGIFFILSPLSPPIFKWLNI